MVKTVKAGHNACIHKSKLGSCAEAIYLYISSHTLTQQSFRSPQPLMWPFAHRYASPSSPPQFYRVHVILLFQTSLHAPSLLLLPPWRSVGGGAGTRSDTQTSGLLRVTTRSSPCSASSTTRGRRTVCLPICLSHLHPQPYHGDLLLLSQTSLHASSLLLLPPPRRSEGRCKDQI